MELKALERLKNGKRVKMLLYLIFLCTEFVRIQRENKETCKEKMQ